MTCVPPAGNWVSIAGYDGLYEVSAFGEVRSLRRKALMAPVRHTDGYLTVKLSNRGVSTRYYVHRLVCEAFHGPGWEGRQVAHLDGDPTNNRPGNLAWLTASENNRHKSAHGTRQAGVRNGRAKFTDEQVASARALHRSGYSLSMITERTGISKSQVHRIVLGEQRQDLSASQAKPLIAIAGDVL